jgi:(1->4)-alpha-D-glucan 1-alpha-D-glucosylmutase
MPAEKDTLHVATSTAPRIPVATYRVQLNRSFPFASATAVVPYLHRLGVTDWYASSFLSAVPGSLHGYDVVDPTALNPELGTEEDFRTFVGSLRARGMGQILDVVSNHMGIARSANRWWQDVLENGPSSRYAQLFDIDWAPLKRELEGKVLLPILGDLYGTVLENQEIRLVYEDGRFLIRYYDHQLPVAPKPSAMILTHGLDTLIQRREGEPPDLQELESIVTALRHLPSRTDVAPESVRERYREKEIIRQRLAALVRDSPTVAAFVDANVRRFNGTAGDPASFDLLDALLGEQAYRLAYWRVASEEINYRRFFDINELAAIRMEQETVLTETHRLIVRLVQEGAVTGLRIDHVDGLYDPGRYLRRLQAMAAGEAGSRPLFVVVEKILGPEESLPADWQSHGTTGYDFLNLVNGLFVNGAHEGAMDTVYARFLRYRPSFDDVMYESKQLIMTASMSSEINVLGHRLNVLSERDRRSRDFTLNSLTHAIREIIACFPIYRTYVTDGPEPVSDRDRAYIRLAVARAKRRNPAVSGVVFDFVRSLLLKEWDDRTHEHRREQLEFVMKFQQTTSPVTAKGVEDTAFYRYNRLVSLNEVGGDPRRFGLSVDDFHIRMRARRRSWPWSLSATSTHDTKRGEDVRARINVLSELPRDWSSLVNRWSRANRRHKSDVEGQPAPDRNEEYLMYQTLIGAWPFEPMEDGEYRAFCERVQAYIMKAVRESKVHTSWVNPHEPYEAAVRRFVAAVLDRRPDNAFLMAFLPFQARVAQLGMWNSLAQVLLKITAPGIPDMYQGTELWELSLVDPDNRRPVDFAAREALLEALAERMQAGGDRRGLVRELIEARQDGRIKLYLTMTALHYRRARPDIFLEGDYLAAETAGGKAEHLCAYVRQRGAARVLVVVPRLVAGLVGEAGAVPVGSPVWDETVLRISADGRAAHYRNVLTGDTVTSKEEAGREVLRVADVLSDCPVALLERVEA